MVCGAAEEWRRPAGEGVLVPILRPSMYAAVMRDALADCFSAWMSVAYASAEGSFL
jgi:hypothetical protein